MSLPQPRAAARGAPTAAMGGARGASIPALADGRRRRARGCQRRRTGGRRMGIARVIVVGPLLGWWVIGG
jgi:hypothetical protein